MPLLEDLDISNMYLARENLATSAAKPLLQPIHTLGAS